MSRSHYLTFKVVRSHFCSHHTTLCLAIVRLVLVVRYMTARVHTLRDHTGKASHRNAVVQTVQVVFALVCRE